MRFSLVVSVAAPALLACGVNTGFVHDNSSGDQHEYRMEISGVRYARSVSGRSSIESFLCLPGGIYGVQAGHGLYQQAMEALQHDAELKPNEVLKDIRTDLDSTCYLLLIASLGLTISADVYELTPTPPPVAPPATPVPTPCTCCACGSPTPPAGAPATPAPPPASHVVVPSLPLHN
jgi:hypothetical protein